MFSRKAAIAKFHLAKASSGLYFFVIKHDFELRPLISIGPLSFGMTASQVDSVLGAPKNVSKVRHISGEARTYELLQVGMNASGKLDHVGIGIRFPGRIMVAGIDVLHDHDALERLIQLDGNPYEWVGFIMLLKLGMSLAGFHASDDAGKAVNFFPTGRYDSFLDKLQPFKCTQKQPQRNVEA